MTRTPASVPAALVLLLLNALVWLAFAIIVAAELHPSLPVSDQVRVIMAILAILTAGLFSALWVFLRRRNRFAYYLALGLLLLVSLLTVTDEFGLPDLVVLAVAVVPLGLLIKDRAWYLRSQTHLSAPGREPSS